MAIVKIKVTPIVIKWIPIMPTYRNPWPRREAYWPLGEKGHKLFKKDVEAFYKSKRYLWFRKVILEDKRF